MPTMTSSNGQKTKTGRSPSGELTGPQITSRQAIDTMTGELTNLRSREWHKKVRLMRRDPTISFVRRLAVVTVLAADWSYEVNANVPDGAADYVKETLEPHRLSLVDTSMKGCIDHGWQSYEKVFQRDDVAGRAAIGLKKLKPLMHEMTTILVDAKTGTFDGLRQVDATGTTIDIPVETALHVAFDVEGTDWYGEPSMAAMERVHDDALEVEKSCRRYHRKIAGTFWIITYPIGKSFYDGQEIDNFEVARRIINSLQSSGCVTVPRSVKAFLDVANAKSASDEAWSIELKTDSSAGQAAFTERSSYLDKLKARALGFPERSVLEGQYGTKADADVHSDFAIAGQELRHITLCQAYSWHLVNQLLEIEYGPDARNTVWVRPMPLTDSSRSVLKDVYKTLLGSPEGQAQIASRIDVDVLAERIGIPTLPESEVEDVAPEDALPPEDVAPEDVAPEDVADIAAR